MFPSRLGLALAFLLASTLLTRVGFCSRIEADPPAGDSHTKSDRPGSAVVSPKSFTDVTSSLGEVGRVETPASSPSPVLEAPPLTATGVGTTNIVDPSAAAGAKPADASPVIMADAPSEHPAAGLPEPASVLDSAPTSGRPADDLSVGPSSAVSPAVATSTPEWVFGAAAAVGILVVATTAIWLVRRGQG